MNLSCFAQNLKPCFSSLVKQTADAFELHITVAPLLGTELERFRQVCQQQGLKPLQIDFSTDQPVQIMTCSRMTGSLSNALLEVNRIRDLLEGHGFMVTRRKLEAAPWNSHVPQEHAPNNLSEYFEHHAKVLLPKHMGLARLERIAKLYQAHLSSNAFKLLPDGAQHFFITRRSYQVTRGQAQGFFDELVYHLKLAGFHVLDTIAEFCVFDSNLELDGVWGQ